MKIHPTTIISPAARIAEGAEIGPYSVIGKNVSIGSGTKIGAHCAIEGWTEIGPGCQIFTGAVIGSHPQDLKYRREKSRVIIGENNVIREYVTINLATGKDGVTRIGSNNLIMAYSHVAHNCVIGNGNVIANGGTLAGHVTIEDRAILGGLVAIHQFVRVGTLAIIGGCSKVTQDVPPYSMVDGHPCRIYGTNSIGLKRAGISAEVRSSLKNSLKFLINLGLSTPNVLKKIEQEIPPGEEVSRLMEFIRSSQRGICR